MSTKIKSNDVLKWYWGDNKESIEEFKMDLINILAQHGKCNMSGLGAFLYQDGSITFQPGPSFSKAVTVASAVHNSRNKIWPKEKEYLLACMIGNGDGWRNLGDMETAIIVLNEEDGQVVDHMEEEYVDGELYYRWPYESRKSIPEELRLSKEAEEFNYAFCDGKWILDPVANDRIKTVFSGTKNDAVKKLRAAEKELIDRFEYSEAVFISSFVFRIDPEKKLAEICLRCQPAEMW